MIILFLGVLFVAFLFCLASTNISGTVSNEEDEQ